MVGTDWVAGRALRVGKGQGFTESNSLRQGMSPSTVSWLTHVQVWACRTPDSGFGKVCGQLYFAYMQSLHICLACDKMCKVSKMFRYRLDSGSVILTDDGTHFGIDVGPF